MRTIKAMRLSIFILIVLMFTGLYLFDFTANAENGKSIKLPPPQKEKGMPLFEALAKRKTDRAFSDKKLPEQVLSNLLWAAFGINRADSGKRTAPSAVNWQEIDLYVALSDGLYIYDAVKNELTIVLDKDIRDKTGRQEFVKIAPLNIMYVADTSKMGRASADDRLLYSAADTGFISQNVYLFCASEGLSTVVRGYVDRDELSKVMKLKPEQRIILAQTVGYPK